MANSKSAQKRVRQAKTRTERNKALKSEVKSLRKKAIEAATSGKSDEAQATLKRLSSAVDRAQKKKVFHKNKAANVKAKTVHAVKGAAGS